MAVFCEFYGFGPATYWDLDSDDYLALRRRIEQQQKANQPPTEDFVAMANRLGRVNG